MENNVNKKIKDDESVVSTKHCPTLKIKLKEPQTKTDKKQVKVEVYNNTIVKTA